VELYIERDKAAFHALLVEKPAIEGEFGEPLDWQELPGKIAARIVVYKVGVDPSDEKQYPQLHTWMLDKLERFRKVFTARVKALSSESENEELED
jgi:hypothetical protein